MGFGIIPGDTKDFDYSVWEINDFFSLGVVGVKLVNLDFADLISLANLVCFWETSTISSNTSVIWSEFKNLVNFYVVS